MPDPFLIVVIGITLYSGIIGRGNATKRIYMATKMKLNLLVLRSANMKSLAGFYSALFGVELKRHSHGKGPEHYGAELEGLVFEVYKKRNEDDDTTSMRFGYAVDSISETLERIREYSINIVSEPKDSPWGERMVFDDPEGHRVELTESK